MRPLSFSFYAVLAVILLIEEQTTDKLVVFFPVLCILFLYIELGWPQKLCLLGEPENGSVTILLSGNGILVAPAL